MNTKSLRSILFMFALTVLCTGALSLIRLGLAERLEHNKTARFQKILLEVLAITPPENASDRTINNLCHSRIRTVKIQDKTIYEALTKDLTTISGYAFPVQGPGFWGPIYGMMGVTPDLEKVIGIVFYEHGETPGLGGRISENWFRKQFEGKPLKKESDKPIFFRFRPPGTHHEENELDAITGATETTSRLEKFLNRSLDEYLGLLREKITTEGDNHGK